MFQPEEAGHAAEGAGQAAAEGAHGAAEGAFDAGRVIIEHVSDSPLDHPLIHLPTVAGIDFSVTKHVLMLWIVSALLFLVITWTVRRFLRQERPIPTGFMTVLEIIVEFVRDSIVEPNVGRKWVNTWTPLLLTIGLFILTANLIGIIPIFDSIALLNHTALNLPEESFLVRMTHGGTTATGNFNVTAALATISFFAIIIAGSRAHGFVKHWKNMIPGGVPVFVYPILIPIEIMGMFVRPFALTARLAANMTGGHIAILAIISFVFIFAQQFNAAVGIGIGAILSIPLAVGISALEAIVVVPVQAYVFTLLTAVFIGMAIHAHH
jgi:F-type H+-transporting ATPase subunit a